MEELKKLIEEPKLTTQADIEAMTDEYLLQEAGMIRMAYHSLNLEYLSTRYSLYLFWFACAVSQEITKRGLKHWDIPTQY